MTILLLGKNGQVGWQLQRALAPLGDVVALDRAGADGLCGNLEDLDGLAATVRALRPRAIVNAAAYTAVDKAESEPELAQRINADAPAALAREAAACGALLLHYSTDYVFDGSGSAAWKEGDACAPLGAYGASKLAGERAIQQSGCAHLIFRTSWVYAARGANFARTMLRLAAEREQLNVIADQWGAPTGAELIADVSAHALAQTLAAPEKAGLYHLAAAGETNWLEYARLVLAHAAAQGANIKAREVLPIATDEWPSAARRPLNSRLDTSRLRQRFGLTLPPWQQGVARAVSDMLSSAKTP
ncbi:MAG: dTDP-4-dehydrorhamnose reductase [Ottowia sp.]|nr:dTDP-4-dehydrorhamnose reductase [Ottowia sp.]